jgi:hypothetical protein
VYGSIVSAIGAALLAGVLIARLKPIGMLARPGKTGT